MSYDSFCQNNLDKLLKDKIVKDSINISDTVFKTGNKFYQKKFISEFNFNDVTIKSLANFVQCDFNDDAIFLSSKFNDEFAVMATIFRKQALFRANEYHKKALFRVSTFYGYSEFRNSIFYKGADFYRAIFKNEADFSGTTIIDTLNFSFVKVEGNRIIDLTKCSPDTLKLTKKVIFIDLTNADIDKIKIDYLKFKLFFDKDISFEDRSNVYLSLLNNFKRDGFSDSYELLDKEYQHFKNTYKGDYKNYLYDILQRCWWNYGYNKEYVFYWTFFLLFFFTILNYNLANTLNQKVYTIENLYYERLVLNKKNKAERDFVDKIYFSLIYTSLVFFAINVKFDKLHFDKKLLLTYFLLIYSLGIICLAYLANYILKS